ncbi:MAG TPA: RidA family protein [Herpetosiphonaceae bacterium]
MTESPAPFQFLNPPALPRPFGYTHAVIAPAGRTVYLSGQVALDAGGQLVGPDDLEAQTIQVFENLRGGLEAAGASFAQVVKFTYFLLDISQIPVVRAVRDRYVDTSRPPASSAVEVRRLFRDDLLIEIEAIAVLPE